MVMTVMVCIWLTSRRNVAENVRVLSLFGTLPGNDRGRPRGEVWRGLRHLGKPAPSVIPGRECNERTMVRNCAPENPSSHWSVRRDGFRVCAFRANSFAICRDGASRNDEKLRNLLH
jgi:hypothetical protein